MLRPYRWRGALLGVCLISLVVVSALSLGIGSRSIGLHDVVAGLLGSSKSDNALVVRELRLPRTVIGLLAGAALAVAGVAAQGLTRNPLADPGILGINSGAALAVVGALHAFALSSLSSEVWIALGGASIASLIVYSLGTAGATVAVQTRIVLAGAAVAAAASSLTTAILLIDQQTLDAFRPWLVGSLSGRGFGVAAQIGPFVFAGIALALFSGPGLNVLALGDDTAHALGYRPSLVRLAASASVILLAGAATAGVGPIAFVGLLVPHMARRLAGPDHRWVIPFSLTIGPVLLLSADVIGRVVLQPGELQVGIVTAVVGAPLFILLARWQKARLL